jgi:signal transduction histidine kinase
MRFRLRWKILLLAIFAPIALVFGALWLVNHSVSENTRSSIDQTLHSSSLVCEKVLAARSRMLESSATVIAQDPRFFAAVAVPAGSANRQYRATVHGVALDFSRIAGSDIFEVIDPVGHMLASVGPVATTGEGREPLLKDAPRRETQSGILVEGGKPYQVTLAPIFAGRSRIGTLLLGTEIGDELAGELRSLTRSEVSFVCAGSIAGSTLREDGDRAALIGALREIQNPESVPLTVDVFEVGGAPETYLTMVQKIPGPHDGGGVVYTVQRSLDAETAFLGEIQKRLTQLGILIVVAALLFGLIVSRRITQPILRLVRGAEEMERGNYDHPLEIRTHDEIGYLADRFREMRDHERAYVSSLEEVARLKSEFINVASHELRTPVSVIRGFSELFSRGKLGPLTDGQREALQGIEENLDGIVRIADNATWMAQIQGQRPILAREQHDIGPVLDEAVSVALADASTREVAISVGATPSALRASLDRPRLIQAIANLVRNAIRFTPDGGKVEVRASQDGEQLVIEIRDTGIGIDAGAKQHLFSRSFLVRSSHHHHSSTTLGFNSAGMGLGLPIARGIVEAHGGRIEVESRPGEGSTFRIRFPIHDTPVLREAA